MKNKKKNLDAAQHELDSTLHRERHNHELRRKILRDLNIEERSEQPAAVAQPTLNKHAVRVHTDHGHHSPYLLDLRAKKEKQLKLEQKKQEINHFIRQHKNEKQQPLRVETIHACPPSGRELSLQRKTNRHLAANRYTDQFTTTWQITIARLAPQLAIAAIALGAIIILPFYGFAYYQKLETTKAGLSALSQDTAADFQTAINSLLNNPSAGGADTAKSQFLKASNSLLQMDEKLNNINFLITAMSSALGNEKYSVKSAKALVNASTNLSLIGIQASKAINDFYSQTSGQSLSQKIEFIKTKVNVILPILIEANKTLADVSPDFVTASADNVTNANKFAEFKNKLASAETILTDFNAAADSLIDLLGKQHKKRFLIVFQNNNELRPTGGFIGSFALAEINNGKITNLRVPAGGSYDLQGSLVENYVSPRPLHLVNAKFEFQDSNWFPDFPTSAKKMAWFLEKANWPTVDAVIAVNASWAAKLVDFVGPISLAQYGKTFTGANFVDELQAITLDKNNKAAPKQIISDLAAKLLETLQTLNEQKLLPLLNLVKTGMTEKDILMYFNDETLQNILEKYNWDAKIRTTDGDYLQIVNSNIGGEKSDATIEQKVDLTVDINANGEVINTLKITRKNIGQPNQKFVYANNVDFLRVYVPNGSKLLESNGTFEVPTPEQFEQAQPNWKIDNLVNNFEKRQYLDPITQTITAQEFGKTVFANWLQTKPGEITTAIFKYKLPTKLKTADSGSVQYSLLLQKQPGQQNNLVTIRVNVPMTTKILHSTFDETGYKTTLNADEWLTLELSK